MQDMRLRFFDEVFDLHAIEYFELRRHIGLEGKQV